MIFVKQYQFELQKNNIYMTINELIAKIDLDKIDTKLLLRHVLNLTQTELIMFNDRILTNNEMAKFELLVKKRKSGMPINYILGYREFYSRKFKVTQDTLIPRAETELLVEETLELAKNFQNAKILDLGTGTGCIAITCKLENPETFVVAVDKYNKTLNVARENANKLKAEISFIKSNWYKNVADRFNIIVSNPPYIANNDIHLNNLRFEPQNALTDFKDGMEAFRCIIRGAKKYLLPSGCLLLEHGFDQAEFVRNLLCENHFTRIRTVKDYANLDRIAISTLA